MEIGGAQEKDSGTWREGQYLAETITSVFFLPGFEKCISKVCPSIGILRVSLEDRSECGDCLLDVLFFSACQLIPPEPYQGRVVAEKELAENNVDPFIVRPKPL